MTLGQKGIHISVWGSFLGQLLLRSMDRAQALYESMELRGFCGEFPSAAHGCGSAASWPYALLCPARELLRDKALLEANGLELPLCLAGVPEL